jgi:hypothetical protein
MPFLQRSVQRDVLPRRELLWGVHLRHLRLPRLGFLGFDVPKLHSEFTVGSRDACWQAAAHDCGVAGFADCCGQGAGTTPSALCIQEEEECQNPPMTTVKAKEKFSPPLTTKVGHLKISHAHTECHFVVPLKFVHVAWITRLNPSFCTWISAAWQNPKDLQARISTHMNKSLNMHDAVVFKSSK